MKLTFSPNAHFGPFLFLPYKIRDPFRELYIREACPALSGSPTTRNPEDLFSACFSKLSVAVSDVGRRQGARNDDQALFVQPLFV